MASIIQTNSIAGFCSPFLRRRLEFEAERSVGRSPRDIDRCIHGPIPRFWTPKLSKLAIKNFSLFRLLLFGGIACSRLSAQRNVIDAITPGTSLVITHCSCFFARYVQFGGWGVAAGRNCFGTSSSPSRVVVAAAAALMVVRGPPLPLSVKRHTVLFSLRRPDENGAPFPVPRSPGLPQPRQPSAPLVGAPHRILQATRIAIGRLLYFFG